MSIEREMEEMHRRAKADPHYHGMGPKFQAYLDEHGVVPQRVEPDDYSCRIGFSEREQKWYGWSHRAVYGFGVGSSCGKGDCHYVADNVDELADDYVAFFADVETPAQQEARRHRITKNYPLKCIHIGSEKIMMPVANSVAGAQVEMAAPGTMPVEAIEFGGNTIHVGRGAWTAQTLEDAKQMAIDFAESVS